MDEQTGEKILKTCWLIICFSVGSKKQLRNAVFAQALQTDGRTDGRTDRLSCRDAFLTDASKKAFNYSYISLPIIDIVLLSKVDDTFSNITNFSPSFIDH